MNCRLESARRARPTMEHCDAKQPDPELRQMLRHRDRQALGQLAERYGPSLMRAATLFLGDRHAAEDVTQDALIAAWESGPRLSADTPLPPWLFGILFNRCRKYRRSLWRRIRRERATVERDQTQGGREPESEDLDMLRRAVGQLDDNLREVVILRYERGFNVAEAAAALDVPEGTVKSRTHAALQKLKEWMGHAHE